MKSPVQIYLSRQKTEPLLASVPVSPRLGIGIVVPCYNEPDLAGCLDSLLHAEKPACDVEILVVVNAPSDAPAEAVVQNKKTLHELSERSGISRFRILFVEAVFPAGKYAGVGLARKTGMDEMARRLSAAGRDDGLIVSLDADCRVSPGYLVALEKRLGSDRKAVAATLAFEHPLPEEAADPVLRQAMIQYELYLRYYRHALKFAGFPYAYYTIGSAFAVKASAYCRAGGMGKYQGGEDFYFLRKVFPLGRTVEIREAKVYPAARLSDRVPFGTGPSLIRLTAQPDGVKLTYPWEAFRWLHFFFSGKERWFRLPADEIRRDWAAMRRPDTGEGLPLSLLAYLEQAGWPVALQELGRNCASLPVFVRRFFDTFDGLRILQSLNALQEVLPLQPVAQAAVGLLNEAYGVRAGEEPLQLLRILQAYDEE